MVDWLGLRGVWLVRIFDEGGIVIGSPRADSAVSAPQSLPWFQSFANRHDVVADARCEVRIESIDVQRWIF